MPPPKLGPVEERMKEGMIPQNALYTRKSSAVAKRAKQYGYQIIVIKEQLIFTRIKEKEKND